MHSLTLYPCYTQKRLSEGFQARLAWAMLNPLVKVLRMPKSSPTGGCRKMLRRSFLFLLGLAAAKLLSDYFSIQQNRNNFIKLVSQLWQKAIAQLDSSQPKVTTEPLPNASAPQASVT